MDPITPPGPTAHPVEVGLRNEAEILLELIRRGYKVLQPFGFNHRYDLVLDLDGRFVRAQCKTGRLRNGAVIFNTRSTRSSCTGTYVRDYEGEIDVFLVYCAATRGLYCVPIRDAPKGTMALRITPPRNRQALRVRWATDYELPA